MIEFAEQILYDFDVVCLLKANSPMTKSADINAVLYKIENESYDSALTVVNTYRFCWNADGPLQNYDVFNRSRRQVFEGLLIENRAVYATTKTAFVNSKNRLSGNIGLVQMSENTLVEIDSMSDLKIVEELLATRLKKEKKHQRIDYFVLGVDRVFTNGQVYYSAEGELAKAFDMPDGMGLEILRQHQVEIVVIRNE